MLFSVPSWVYYIVNNLFFFGLRAKSLSIWKIIFGLYNSQDFNCLLVCTGIHLSVFFCSMPCYLFCSMIHSNDVHNFHLLLLKITTQMDTHHTQTHSQWMALLNSLLLYLVITFHPHVITIESTVMVLCVLSGLRDFGD